MTSRTSRVTAKRFFGPTMLVIALGALVATASEDGPTLCPFALMTGTACPLCGMTRAAAHLVRGELSASAVSHPLIFLVAAALIAYLVAVVKGRQVWNRRWTGVAWAATGALFLGVWLIRLATGTLPPV